VKTSLKVLVRGLKWQSPKDFVQSDVTLSARKAPVSATERAVALTDQVLKLQVG